MKRHLDLGRGGHRPAAGDGGAKFPLLNRGNGFLVEAQTQTAHYADIRHFAVGVHINS
jgi:hypothetical protein